MTKKLALHLITGLFAIAVLIVGYQWFKGFSQDPDIGKADTADCIAAVEYVKDGSQVVLFKRDGTKLASPGYKQGSNDRDPAWRPDGDRLFFASDREDQIVNIFRWDPERNAIEKRSIGRRGKSNIAFGPAGFKEPVATAIITSGGLVLSYNPRDGSTKQLLPPVLAERTGTEDGGSADQFEESYKRIGNAFKEARWGKDRKSIVATMRRDGGEVLIVQGLELETTKDGIVKMPVPMVIAAGERIDFDVSPDGNVAVAVLGFQFVDRDNVPPQFVKNGVATPPYRHAIIGLNTATINEGAKLVAASPNDDQAIARPRLAPDGQSFLALLGKYNDTGQFTAEQLVEIPLKERGVQELRGIMPGNVLEAEWNPTGEKIVYVKRANGRRTLFTVGRDGRGETDITKGSGDFGSPRFSPQTAKQP